MEICSKNRCSGCGMCSNICSLKAIKMQKDDKGFYFPVVDIKKCVNCQQCIKLCPSNNKIVTRKQKPLVYAAWNKDKYIRKESTSGGIFSLLAERIIDLGGVVAGVAWTADFKTQHMIVDNKANLLKIRGSKYVQSNTKQIYQHVKEYLKQGKYVLFSGTPCQVHALRLFLGTVYERLITVDVVCHGVPSQLMFNRYLKEINSEINRITKVIFRKKKNFWSYAYVHIESDNQKNYEKLTIDDSYFNLFNFNYSLRENCYNCQYTNLNRVSDITLMDFWGYKIKSFKMRNYEKGISAILINSDKGMHLFRQLKNKLVYETRKIEDVLIGNQCLSKPFLKPQDCDEFWNDYLTGMGIHDLEKNILLENISNLNIIDLDILNVNI